MNAAELFLSGGRSAKVFFCGECKTVKRTEQDADKCCKPTVCECGDPCEKYWTACQGCRDKKAITKERERSEAARIINQGAYDGFVFDPSGAGPQDGYYYTLTDCLEDCDNEDATYPKYVYCCTPETLKMDIDAILERFDDDGYEDMLDRLDIPESLTSAIDEFNKINKNDLTIYTADFTRKILVDPPTQDGD